MRLDLLNCWKNKKRVNSKLPLAQLVLHNRQHDPELQLQMSAVAIDRVLENNERKNLVYTSFTGCTFRLQMPAAFYGRLCKF